MRTILRLILCTAAALSTLCSYATPSWRDSLISQLGYYSRTGRHDSVIAVSHQGIRTALERGDTLAALYSEIFTAQSYLFMDLADSVKYYADRVARYRDSGYDDPRLWLIFNNVMGSWSLRVSMDYSEAYQYFSEGVVLAEASSDTASMISMLLNIMDIYYYRGSADGMSYAERAWRLAQNTDTDSFGYYRCVADIGMAKMLLLSGNTDSASAYLDEALKTAESSNSASQYAQIYLLKAGISVLRQDDTRAEEYYNKAISHIAFSDYTTHIQLLLHYGEFLERHGRNAQAMRMYISALEVSERSKSIELKHLVLSKAADLAYRLGKKNKALEYYRMARLQTDSLVGLRNNEFSKLLFMNQDIRHSQDMLAKELDRQKAYEYLKLSTLTAILVLAIAAMLIILYIRQKRMYRTLVEQHRNNMQRLDMRLEESNSGTDGDDRHLYRQIERLMREEKFYLNKDISLDSLAKKLGTNRTYCSNAINTCAGMNFYRYIDVFRIEEATRRLVQGGKGVMLKELAQDLGYNSLTVFSKAFVREVGCPPSVYRNNVNRHPELKGEAQAE